MSDLLTTPESAEQSVLSAMMQNAEAIFDVVEILPPERFLLPKHEMIAAALLNLAERDHPVDPVSVISELERQGNLGKVGGPTYIHTLYGYATTWHNASYYAEIVRRESTAQRLKLAGAQVAQLANSTNATELEIIESARRYVDDAAGVPITEEQDPREAIHEMIEGIGSATPAFPTPWLDLTHTLRGFRPGALYIVAARPALGKSALALQMATELERHGYVGFFSLEMGATEVRRRQLAQVEGIALSLIEGDKRLPDHLHSRALKFAEEHPARILLDDKALTSIANVRQKVRSWVRKYEMSGIVVDYLQLMASTAPEANRLQALTEITRELKILAKEMNVPVIALSQLNRNLESRADKTPMLSDLRESGSIEQDADVVILLHREMGYTDYTTKDLDVIVAKNRNGPTGRIVLEWQGDFVRAVEGADQYGR